MTSSKPRKSGRLWPHLAAALLLLGLDGGIAKAAAPGPADPQQSLDFIAVLPFADTFKEVGVQPPPAGPFSSWTPEQKQAFPPKLKTLCASFWSFINMAPGAKILPASLPGGDDGALGVDVCVVGHMPGDWPDRAATLQSAMDILARAKQAGSPLHLPVSIKP